MSDPNQTTNTGGSDHELSAPLGSRLRDLCDIVEAGFDLEDTAIIREAADRIEALEPAETIVSELMEGMRIDDPRYLRARDWLNKIRYENDQGEARR